MVKGILNLLFVTPYLPCRGVNAGRTRMFEIIIRIAKSHRVSVISFAEDKDEPHFYALKNVCRRLDGIPYPKKIQSPFLRLSPGIAAGFESSKMKEKIESSLKNERFDAVFCEYISMSQYLSGTGLPPRILTLHEWGILSLKRDLKSAAGLRERLEALPKLGKIFFYYRKMLHHFDRIVLFTKKEKESLLRFFPGLPAALIPMGVDTDYFKDSSVYGGDIDLLYVGYFGHRPNIDAVFFFCNKILPIIRKRYPGMKLSIAGGSVPQAVKSLEDKGMLDIIGPVDDIRDYLARAKVFVMPIVTGAGMRGKLLEAFSAGRAVVSTSIGAEGIDIKDGEDILIGDTPEEFAFNVIAALESANLRKMLGANAKKRVEDGFTWGHIAQMVIEEAREVIRYSSNI